MKYCFIIAHCRFSYFNIEKIDANTDDVRFVLIVEKMFLDKVPENFKQFMYRILIVDEINFTPCKVSIDSLQATQKELVASCIACTDEKSLMTAAELREHFGMCGTKPYQYVPFSTKRLMKQILSLHNIKVPKFLDFDGKHTEKSLPKYHGYLQHLFAGSYVVKPLDGGGSADTAIIRNSSDLTRWYGNCYSANNDYTVEEFIDGTFYHCDSFVINQEVKFAAVFEYLFPNLDFTFGKPIGGVPVHESSSLFTKALQFNKKVIEALRAPNGALHLEFFVKNNEIIFVEIGARPGGKTIALCHEKNSGINLYEYTLRHELKLPLNFILKTNPFHSWVSFPKTPGIVKKLNTPILNSELEIDWHIKVGDKIDRFSSSLGDGVVADLILFNRNYNKLIEDVNILRTHQIYL